IWMETGRSSSVYSAYSRVRSMPRTRPSELTISLTTRPQPPWRLTRRRNAVSVMPAIGATPSAGSTGSGPIFIAGSIRAGGRRRGRLCELRLVDLVDFLVLPLDDRLLAQLLQVLEQLGTALLAEHLVGHLVAHLLEGRHHGLAAAFELDQLPAPLAANRLRDLADLQSFHDVEQLRRHLLGVHRSDQAAVGLRRRVRARRRDRRHVLAGDDPRTQRFHLRLRLFLEADVDALLTGRIAIADRDEDLAQGDRGGRRELVLVRREVGRRLRLGDRDLVHHVL